MSGGSFNYAYEKLTDTRVFEGLSDYRAIEQYLRDIDKQDAADEIYRYINIVETYYRRLMIEGKRIADLMQEVEWVASCDSKVADIDTAYRKLVGLPEQSEGAK